MWKSMPLLMKATIIIVSAPLALVAAMAVVGIALTPDTSTPVEAVAQSAAPDTAPISNVHYNRDIDTFTDEDNSRVRVEGSKGGAIMFMCLLGKPEVHLAFTGSRSQRPDVKINLVRWRFDDEPILTVPDNREWWATYPTDYDPDLAYGALTSRDKDGKMQAQIANEAMAAERVRVRVGGDLVNPIDYEFDLRDLPPALGKLSCFDTVIR